MAGRPKGARTNKLWGDALRKAALEFHEGKKGPKRLELAAKAVLNKIISGDMSGIREFGERIDGKVAQPVIGGQKGDPPVQLALIELVPVHPRESTD